jgi:glycosyltransferase involved in cell wall biosynthesis
MGLDILLAAEADPTASDHTEPMLAPCRHISVVVTCYNQGHFLRDAIESVLAQTYPTCEIIVVDDGSTDDTAAVARSYPGIRYIYQKNQGLSAARNAGWRACTGDFVVFLDADDRLLPEALSAGAGCLEAHRECAFVSGHFRYINADGTLLREFSPVHIDRDHYRAFLKGNFIAMHATVMYRLTVLHQMGGFDTSLDACEDYDLYLRIARCHPVCCHQTIVAEYRQHSGNMSANAALMLRTAVDVLRSQQAFVASESLLRKALRAGLRSWTAHYGKHLVWQVLRLCRTGNAKEALQSVITLLRYGPYFLYSARY